MYEIIESGNNKWTLVIGNKARFHGSFQNVVKICIRELKFDAAQLDQAVAEMCKPQNAGHDTLHFGVYKKFLFSYDSRKEQRVG